MRRARRKSGPSGTSWGSRSGPPGPALLSMGRTRVLCSAAGFHDAPPLAGTTADGSRGSTPCCRPPREAFPTPGQQGTPGRANPGDPAADRAFPPGGHRSVEAGGADDHRADGDVLQADAGTRTASITGGFIALSLALRGLQERGAVGDDVLRDSVAAVAPGIVNGEPVLDLCDQEDAGADVDANVVMTGSGRLVEVQGTAEGDPFSRPSSTRCWTSPRPASSASRASSARRAARWSHGHAAPARRRLLQHAQASGDRADLLGLAGGSG